jgi:hypothetical protein
MYILKTHECDYVRAAIFPNIQMKKLSQSGYVIYPGHIARKAQSDSLNPSTL